MIGFLPSWSKFTKSGSLGRLRMLIWSGTLLLFTPVFAQAQLFDIALSSNSVEEGAPSGTLVGTLSTPGTLGIATYTLPAATNDNAQFAINGDQLLTAFVFDYEVQETYTITIEASLLGLGVATKDFVIDIVDAETIVLANNTINENEPSGTLIGSLSSNNETDNPTFLLPSGQNDNDFFSIMNDQLVSAAFFDYETQTSYTVTIQAIDELNQISSEDFTIHINDIGPIDLLISKNSIDENMLPETVVGSFSATNGIAPITYILIEGPGATHNDQFFVDGNGLKTNYTFDFETQNIYNIRVQATDATTEFFIKSFSISVNNLSEGPTDITLTNSNVNEHAPIGTLIGTLSATDATGNVTYSLPAGQNDNDQFSINGDQLLTNAVFDFENKSSYNITVQVVDESNQPISKDFTISITDLPGPTNILLSGNSVEEEQPAGSPIGTLSATGGTGNITFSLPSGQNDNNSFSINNNELQTGAPFDFEVKSQYAVTILAEDQNNESFTKDFTINVTDLAEGPTDLSVSASNVNENQPVGTAIGTFSSVGGTAPYTYTLVSGTGSTDNNQFTLNGDQLQTNAVFDFETKNSFSIRAQTTDNNGGSFAKAFTISVSNLEEGPTDITLTNNTVSENEPEGTVVGTLSASGATGTLIYSLPTGQQDNAQFAINGDQLQSNAVFDFEAKSSYTITVQAVDDSNEPFSKNFTINVTDLAEGPTDLSVSASNVNENQPVGTAIGTFSSVGGTAPYTYTLVSGTGSTDNNQFTLNGDQLQTNAVFDFETKNSYSVRVQTTDNNGGSFAKAFTISVNNLVEAPTDLSLSASLVNENQPVGTAIGTFSSVGGTTPFIYQLVSGSGDTDNAQFLIDNDQLKTNTVFDFEVKSSFSIRAQTTDNNGGSFAKAFTISVTDVMEAPIVVNPISDFPVNEDATNSTFNLINVFSDPDGDGLSYSVQNNNTTLVQASTGGVGGAILTLDYQANQSGQATITVTASDGSENVQDVFVVTVNSVNDKPTTSGIAAVNVQENSSSVNVNLFNAFADVEDTDDALTYQVTSNSPAGLVSTSISKPNLTLNFATNQSGAANLTVRATDTGGEFVETTFTVNVEEVNNAPVVSNPISDFSVNEDAANTTIDLNNVFSDSDGDELSYSVQNNNTTLVQASVNAGTLTLDYQPNQSGQATVTVTASDGDENVQDVFIVTVNPVNDKPTTSGIADVNASEDASPMNINLFNAFADVEDADEALTYNVVSNSNTTLVSTSISKPNLTLSFAANQNGSSNITIEAVDAGGASVQTSFKVTVNAVNDKPTTTGIANVTVNENATAVKINLFNAFADVEDTDAQLNFQVANTNTAVVTTQIINPDLILSFVTNASGSATITVKATDTGGQFVETSFTVNVVEVASAPIVASSISDFSVNEDAANTTIDLNNVFSDPNGDALTYTVQNNNTVLVNATVNNTTDILTLDYLPNQSGQATILVTASDGNESVQDEFVVTVSPVNNPPSFVILNNPPVSKEDAGPQKIAGFASDIKDGDDDTQQLTFNLTQTAFTGMLAFASGPAINVATGDLTYTPKANTFGTADYSVTLSDNGPTGGANNNTSAPQSFTIVVQPVPDPPGVPTEVTIDEKETASGLAVNRNTVDSTEVTHFKITNIIGGTLYQNDGVTKINDGSFITVAQGSAGLKFTPGTAYTEKGGFKAKGSTTNNDTGLGGESTANIRILPFPDKPVVTHAKTQEDTQTTSGLVIERNPNDGDEVDFFRITNITGGQLFTNNGAVPINNGAFIPYAAGKAGLKFTPTPNSTANGSFAVQASLGQIGLFISDTAQAVIKVISVNDAPVLTAPATATVNEDATVAIPGISIADIDLGEADLTVQLSVTSGILTLSQTTGLTFSAGSNGSASMTINGTLAAVNNALGTLQYQGNEGFSGTETLEINASDNGATGEAGGEQTDTASVSITVNPVNDSPVLSAVEDKSLPYTEDAPATNISSTIVLTDEDSETMLSASIKITGNYSGNQDSLVFPTNHPHLLGSFNVGTGELKLTRKNTGSDFSVSVFQDALRSVKYKNFETANPSIAIRTVTFTVTDEAGIPSNAVSRNITLSLINDPPELVNIEGDAMIFQPNTIPQISQTISVIDDDGGNIVFASVRITQNYKVGEDILNFTPLNGIPITGTFFSERGELTLQGTTTLANYTAALRNVKYLNINAFPTSANRLVTFSVRDTENNKSNEQSRFIVIGSSDVPPSIFDFEKAVEEDAGLTFALKDFEDAFFDEEDTPAEIRIRSVPQHGILELNGSEIAQNQTTGEGFAIDPAQIGNLVYIPDENYNGEDNFKWNATDGSSFAANDAFVNMIINPVNDEPVITSPSNMEVDEDVPTVITDVSVNDPDAGNGVLTVTLSVDIGMFSLIETGGLTFTTGDGELDNEMEFDGTLTNINNALNTLTYLSSGNFSGNLEMEFTVKDNGNTGTGGNKADIALIGIEVNPVNDPPALSNMETAALSYTENDPPLQITGNLTLDDVDDPKNAIAQAIVTISEGYTNTGEELLTFTPSDGIAGQQEEDVLTLTGKASLAAYQEVLRTVMYENKSSNPGNTPRTISIQLIDELEGESNIVVRSINVTPVNDPPALSNIETETLPYYEGQTSVQITSTLEANDPDSETLSEAVIQIDENYIEGEDSLSVNGLVNITASWDKATGTLTLSGADAKAEYQNALRSVNYHNLNGTPDTVTRAISFWVGDGIDQSNVVSRNLTIVPNAPPVVSSFEKTTDEDVALSFSADDFNAHYQDDNIPTEELEAIEILSLPPNGSLIFDEEEITQEQLNAEGLVITSEDIGKLVYLPNLDFSGKDSIGWTASDGIKKAAEQAYTRLTVNPVNDPPTVGNFNKEGEEDTPVTFTAAEFNALYADVDNDGMQKVIIRGLPVHGVLKLNGFELPLNAEISTGNLDNLVYEPELNYSGEDSIRWGATDPTSVSTSSALILLTIAPVNDAPEVISFTKTSNENAPIPLTVADFDTHFNDVENDELQKVVITRLPLNGALTLNEEPVALNDTIDRAELDLLIYTPDTDFLNGKDNFGWKASDNSLYAAQEANVNIIIGTGVSDFAAVTNEDTPLAFTAEVFAENFNNASGVLSAIRIDSLPPHGTLAVNEEEVSEGQIILKNDIPNLIYTPAPDFNGKDSLYWNGRNGGDFAPENAKVLLTVNAVNDAPVISELDDQLILVNQSAGPLAFSVNDVDSDPETLVVTVSSDNGNLVPNQEENLILEPDESLQYSLTITPMADSTGSATITISASDGKLTGESTFTLNVVIDILEVDAGSDLEIVEGESVAITATTSGGDAPFAFTWTCNQPECAIDDNTQATINVNPQQATTYFVEVQEAKGLIAYDTITVNVTPRPTALDIPTGFTPDGVEPNNLWIIDDIQLFENVIVEVYNRYGTQVFRSEGYNEPWDGSYKGDLLPVGTYYYVVNIDNGSQVYKGSVVILR